MDINHPRRVQQTAADCLSAVSCNPKKLVLFHSGIALAFTLLLTTINFIVDRQIGSTGGLSGIGLRSILSTVQTVLRFAGNILLPFWQIGFVAAALDFARKRPVNTRTLLKGFQRFPSVFGLMIGEALIILLIGFFCVQISSSIYMFTPMAEPLFDVVLPLMEESSVLTDPTAVLDEVTLDVMSDAIMPLLIISAVIYMLVMIPILFRFRLAELVLMDEERCGGLRALLTSCKLMKRNCIRLFKLDLRFWLFYVLQALSLLLGYADMLLPMLGVPLPMDADVAFFGFYIVHIIASLALYVWAKPMLQTSYAVFYDNLLATSVPPMERPAPKKLPWDYS